MYKNLENYLGEVSRYLVSENPYDILKEIRGIVLDKADEFGEVSEKTIEKALASLGDPRTLAANYGEGKEIIAPDLRNYLFMYTSLLFAIHLGLVVIASIARTDILVLPFFYTPQVMEAVGIFLFLPLALIFDFGLVSLILFAVSQWAPKLSLPMPRVGQAGARAGIWTLLAQLAGLAGFIAMWHFLPQLAGQVPESEGTVIFPTQLLLLPPIFAFAIGAITSAVQLLSKSRLVPVLGSVAAMAAYWFLGVTVDNQAIFDISGEPWTTFNSYGFRVILILMVVLTTLDLVKRAVVMIYAIRWKREIKFTEPGGRDWLNTLVRLVLYMTLLALGGIYILPVFPLLFFALVVLGLLFLVRWHNTNFGFQCRKCGNRFEVSTLLNFVSPHGVWKDSQGKYAWKWLRCPQCKKFSAARVVKKEKQ